MKKKIINMCDKTVYNYRLAKEELRYDGDYINHFSAIIYGSREEDIPVKRVKEIRSIIKNETSRISSFRGDILYIVSVLIALEKDAERFVKEMLETYGELRELDFRESQYLVLASYAMVKHVKEEERYSKLVKMREIYGVIRREYQKVTNHEDYLECALLAINELDDKFIIRYMNGIFEKYGNCEKISKNSIQAVSMTLLLNANEWAGININELFSELDEEGIKIAHQFLPLLGSIFSENRAKEYIEKINEIIRYLCSEESEYEFYMDKSFRFFIGMVLLEYSRKNKEERYINELFSKGVYSLLVSKNQGIFDEVLA